MASASADASIRIWNPWNYTQLKLISNAHNSLVRCVKWLGPGNTFLASAGGDFYVNIWDTKSYKFLKRLEGHTNYINTIEIFQDGRLATGSDDSSIRLWNINSAKAENIFSYSTIKFNYIKRLEDGRLAAIANRSGIYIFNFDLDYTFFSTNSYKMETVIVIDGQNAYNCFSGQNVFILNFYNQIEQTINTYYNITSLERYPVGNYKHLTPQKYRLIFLYLVFLFKKSLKQFRH